MSFRRALGLSLMLTVGTPVAAWADGMIIPFVGVNFGGRCCNGLSNAINTKRVDWGASFAYMGAGVLGIEGDIGYSPDFFGKTDLGGSSVLTATGNLLLGIPIGGQKGVGIRPYRPRGLGRRSLEGRRARSSPEPRPQRSRMGFRWRRDVLLRHECRGARRPAVFPDVWRGEPGDPRVR